VAGESTELSRSGHGYSVTRRDRCLPPDVASCRPHVHGSCQFIAYVFSCMQKWHRTCTFPWLHMSLLQNKQWATKCYSPQTLKYKHFPSAFKNNPHVRCQSSCEHAKLFFGIMHAWANWRSTQKATSMPWLENTTIPKIFVMVYETKPENVPQSGVHTSPKAFIVLLRISLAQMFRNVWFECYT
jgi:hypothetical protein